MVKEVGSDRSVHNTCNTITVFLQMIPHISFYSTCFQPYTRKVFKNKQERERAYCACSSYISTVQYIGSNQSINQTWAKIFTLIQVTFKCISLLLHHFVIFLILFFVQMEFLFCENSVSYGRSRYTERHTCNTQYEKNMNTGLRKETNCIIDICK